MTSSRRPAGIAQLLAFRRERWQPVACARPIELRMWLSWRVVSRDRELFRACGIDRGSISEHAAGTMREPEIPRGLLATLQRSYGVLSIKARLLLLAGILFLPCIG